MNKSPIILSIIIPCYRVERYIGQCLDTIYQLALSIEQFEVLCFDDNAPDGTPRILDEYAAQHANMYVVHSDVNIGPGGGRNRLLDIAQGKYVWYVDSDDLMLIDYVPEILREAEKNDLDVLTFTYQECDNAGNLLPQTHVMPDSEVSVGYDLANQIFPGGWIHNMGFPWRFIMRRAYLQKNHIRFPENMIYGEDTVWMPRVVLLAQRLQSTSLCAYVYWHHEDSTCGTLNRVYPGRTIYEKTMLTTMQLIEFAAEMKECYEVSREEIWMQHSKTLHAYAQSHYINQLPIMLSRSTKKERTVFYQLLANFAHRNEIIKLATPLTRALMNPVIGPCASMLLSIVYKLTHKAK